jgi:Family of unknown function (DUF6090)
MKFLRNIRKKALNEHKIGGYLAYALGEIVLVVIGILLAVQINDYYESVKIRDTEIIFLKNLRAETMNNHVNLMEAISYQERSLNANDTLLNLYSAGYNTLRHHKIDSLFAEVQWGWIFNPETSVLNSIKTTNQFNIIRNQKIKDFITTYEELVTDAQEESIIIQDLIINKYVPQVSKFISLKNRLYYTGYKSLSPSKFKSDYSGLFNDREIESTLAYIYAWRIVELEEERKILKLTREFITVVDSELAFMEKND